MRFVRLDGNLLGGWRRHLGLNQQDLARASQLTEQGFRRSKTRGVTSKAEKRPIEKKGSARRQPSACLRSSPFVKTLRRVSPIYH